MENLQTSNILSALIQDWKSLAKEANYDKDNGGQTQTHLDIGNTENKGRTRG